MMDKQKTSWRPSTGVTLIEVLAALALLGSLAVAMILSRGQLMDQHRRAEQKLEAVRVADRLLAQWWESEPKSLPINSRGEVQGHDGWVWETSVVEKAELQPFNAQVVRYRILNEAELDVSIKPVELTTVDLVMPVGGTP